MLAHKHLSIAQPLTQLASHHKSLSHLLIVDQIIQHCAAFDLTKSKQDHQVRSQLKYQIAPLIQLNFYFYVNSQKIYELLGHRA